MAARPAAGRRAHSRSTVEIDFVLDRYGTPCELRAIMWRYHNPVEIGFGAGARGKNDIGARARRELERGRGRGHGSRPVAGDGYSAGKARGCFSMVYSVNWAGLGPGIPGAPAGIPGSAMPGTSGRLASRRSMSAIGTWPSTM